MQINVITAYISFGSVVLPLSLAALLLKYSKEMVPIMLLVLFSFLADFLSLVLIRQAWVNTTYVIGNLYLISQFALLIWFYSDHLNKPWLRYYALPFYVILYLYDVFLHRGAFMFNSQFHALICLILILLSLASFYKIMNELPVRFIYRLPLLWVSFAVLIYYAGNFFLFLVNNYLSHGDSGTHSFLWILHNLLNITKNVLFAIALWQSYRSLKSSTSSSSVP
jgi:hypothetical protein